MLHVVIPLLCETTKRSAQLEGPQEVVGLLEVRADSVNLVNKILNIDDTILSKCLLNDAVVRRGGSALVLLAITTLVNQLPDTLQVGVSISNIRLNPAQHIHGSLVHLHEHPVEDLSQPQQLHDRPDLGVHVVDTPDPDDEHKLQLWLDIETTLELSLPLQIDQFSILLLILLLVLMGALKDESAVLGVA